MKDKCMEQQHAKKEKYTALIVEDDEDLAIFISNMLKIINLNSLIVGTLKEARFAIEKAGKIEILILDYRLPDGTANNLLENLQKNKISLPTVVMSGDPDSARLPSLVAGANVVIGKPFSDAEFLMVIRNLLKVREMYEQLEHAQQIIQALVAAVEARDDYTSGHSARVAKYSIMIFDAIGFNDAKDRESLRVGGLLHDIGKIGIPDSVLKSTSELTDEEYSFIKKHPIIGYEICKGLDRLSGSLPVILQHHERLDGSGYPYGLKDGEISYLAQIVMIPDVYDAITTKRTYREAMSCARAIKIMDKEAAEGKLNSSFYETFREEVLKEVSEG